MKHLHETCGRVADINPILKKHSPGKIFLVTGSKSYEKTGLKSFMEKELKGKKVLRHWDFSKNPCAEDLVQAAEKYHSFAPDMIIAAGGGSVLDTAKLLSVLPPGKENIENIIKSEKPVPQRKIPFIAVPTTSGSGSEATHFAVVYLNGKKYSVAAPSLRPDYVILDPRLTSSLPKRQRMTCVFDAFSQAVESFWSVNASPESVSYSLESIRIIKSNYTDIIKSPSAKTLKNIMKASHLSGKAINITKTTGPHAFSYCLTSEYGIPHGYAVILFLPPFIEYNAGAGREKLREEINHAEYSKKMKKLCELLNSASPTEASQSVKKMVTDAGFSTSLGELGINSRKDIENIINSVNLQRLSNNPAKLQKKDIKDIVYSIR